MSVLRYTFTSLALQQELTILLTLPEATPTEATRSFATAVFVPDARMLQRF